jgi:hypothetical protein
MKADGGKREFSSSMPKGQTMRRRWNSRFLGGAVAGLAAGLLVGVGMLVGAITGLKSNQAQAALDEIKLRAAASSSTDTFAIATGYVDEDGEAIFCLDFITGELQCFVLDARNGKVAGWFGTNVTEALKRGEDTKKPRYVLVTGAISARGVSGNARPAASVVYVADGLSGEIAAYSFLWNQSAKNSYQGQRGRMEVVQKFKGRTVELRE